jgi:hypothetical protein
MEQVLGKRQPVKTLVQLQVEKIVCCQLFAKISAKTHVVLDGLAKDKHASRVR